VRVLGDPVVYGIGGLITLGTSGWPKVSARVAAVLYGARGLSAGFHGVPEWWLWRWVRRALGQLLARPARSWPLVGKDNFVADQAVAGQILPPRARMCWSRSGAGDRVPGGCA
jgi:hypothetical protein